MTQPLLDIKTPQMAAADTPSATLSTNSEPNTVRTPAVQVPLQGKYLIEASAGTGKTWTLTGIVLRLLIEAKRPPEHIIATTFTRAAAAEMRDRIHKRLVDFYHLLQWLRSLQASARNRDVLYPYLDHHLAQQALSEISEQDDTDKKTLNKILRDSITADQRQARWGFIKKNAQLSGMTALIDDPINHHLSEYLLDRAISYPLDDAIRRTKLVLTTLDKLFVGTLDSLAQKWLSEYSAETGHQPGMQISMDEEVMVTSIIHDTVRGFYSRIYHTLPKVYELLQSSNRLTAPDDHKSVAQKSLQFISTPINPVNLDHELDMDGYLQLLDAFVGYDLSDIEPYFDMDFRVHQGMGKKAVINTKFDSITDIQASIQQHGISFFAHLDATAASFFSAIPEAFLHKDEGGKGFSVKNESERLTFINLQAINLLKQLYEQVQDIEHYLDLLTDKLNYDIAINVRQQLPVMLEAKNETTFTLQMVRLNQALSGRRGAQLARYIRHHYPVALIDESQDINGEQAHMIEQIYLSPKASESTNQKNEQKKRHAGFLLLVGDPKQAIYGFRGGDVANFNAIKAKFDRQHIMSLDVNRRSSEHLISALNHWFGRGQLPTQSEQTTAVGRADNGADHSDSVSDSLANLGSQIYYQHITAAKTEPMVSWQEPARSTDPHEHQTTTALFSDSPVTVLHLSKDNLDAVDEYQLTARHIQAVLASGQTVEGRAVQPSDIGVLGKNKAGLKQVENELVKLGVPTLQTAEVNIFTTKMAEDLAALLDAMLRPHRRDRVNRVLTGSFYQKSLAQVQCLIQIMDSQESDGQAVSAADGRTHANASPSYQDFQNHLKYAAQLWQNRGILTALHFLFKQDPMQKSMTDHQNTQSHSPAQAHEDSLWVALTHLDDSTRNLMDLRHLLDILAMFGMHIGEHELLAWFHQQMGATTTPDWARQQPLPTESGVQLMTIHKSKGLEFPLVYVIDVDSPSKAVSQKTKNHLFLYGKVDDEHVMRRYLSIRAGKESRSAQQKSVGDEYAKMQTQEQYEEYRRLIYVALTRASSQLYMVLKDTGRRGSEHLRPMAHWLGSESTKLALPERLQPYIGWLDGGQVLSALADMTHQPAASLDALDKGHGHNTTRIDYTPAYDALKQQFFRGWAKTSFTALSRKLDEQERVQAVHDDSMEEALDINGYSALLSANTDDQISDANAYIVDKNDIRFTFIKGSNAGTFLHEIFEKIDFHNDQRWSMSIDQAIRKYQLPSHYASLEYQQREQESQHALKAVPMAADEAKVMEEGVSNNSLESLQSIDTPHALEALDHQALMAWIGDVLETPLAASRQPLSTISSDDRVAELSFNMGLSEGFGTDAINDVFARFLPDEPDKHITLEPQSSGYIYRYLRGEIDLVYEYAGKFYVVDYKSNYLGDSLSDYNQASLSAAMSKAGYWLQAAIYQVALHRFLTLRLPEYQGNEEEYLGAVEYVFLRGISSQSARSDSGDQGFGRIAWDIPIALVRALDEMFGTPCAH